MKMHRARDVGHICDLFVYWNTKIRLSTKRWQRCSSNEQRIVRHGILEGPWLH